MKTRRDTTTGKRYSDADKGHPISNGSHKGYGATRFTRHRLAARVMSLILAVVLILVLLPDYTPASLTVQATGTEELTTEEAQTTGGSPDGSNVDTQTTEESSDGNGTGEAGGSSTTETSEESTSGTNGTDSGTTDSGDSETSTVQTAINAMTAFTQKAAELGWTQTMTTEETAAWVNALSQENVDALKALMETASEATDALTVEEYNQLESAQADLFAQLELLADALGAYEPMETATAPSGYTTDSNGLMAYCYKSENYNGYGGTIDLQGYYNGQWRTTTYGNHGFAPYYRTGSSGVGTALSFSNNVCTISVSGKTLKIERSVEFSSDGQLITMAYRITNTSNEAVSNFSFGVKADTQVAGNDSSTNEELILDNEKLGFVMEDTNTGTSFMLACRGVGGVDANNYWYGNWSSNNSTFHAFLPTSSSSGTSSDSAIAFSWQGQPIEANSTVEYKAVCGIGDIEQLKKALSSLKASLNYKDESISGLTAGATYEIKDDGETYYVKAGNDGTIPLEGTATDKDGKSVKYSLIDSSGKSSTVTVTEVDPTTKEAKSESSKITVAGRPTTPSKPDIGDSSDTTAETPQAAGRKDVIIDDDEITITNPVSGQEYSIDGGKTWESAGTDGTVSFTGLEKDKDYTIITRIAATDSAPASAASEGVTIKSDERKAYNTGYIVSGAGTFDYESGTSHQITVTVADAETSNASVTYSADKDKAYSSENPIYTEPGTYTVYYRITRTGFYPVYGQATIVINKLAHADINYTKQVKVGSSWNCTLQLKDTDLESGAAVGTPVTGGSVTMTNPFYNSESKTLSYTAPNKSSSWIGYRGTITLLVTGATYYKDYNIILTVTYTSKTVVEISGLSSANSAYDGTAHVGYATEEGKTVSFTEEYSGSVDSLEKTYYRKNASGTYEKTTADNSGASSSGGVPVYAGDYRVTLSIPSTNSTYTGSVTLDFTISPREAVITWSNTAFTYNGAEQQPTATITNLVSGDSCTAVVTGGHTNAGTYTATVSELSGTSVANYILPKTDAGKQTAFTIAPKTITSDMITLDESSFVHDGNAKSPAVTVKDSTLATQAAQGTKTLTVCTTEDGATGDYALSGDTQATKYGKYTLKVTGKNNYTGTVDVTWNITDTTAPTFGEITYQEGTSSKVKNAWNWIIGKEVMTVTVPITEQGSGLTKDQIAITLTKASDCTLADSAAKAGGIDLTGDITNGYTLTFTVPKGFAGTYEITATDEAKNAGTYRLSQTLGEKGEIVIDSLAPSVTFELDKADYKGTSGAYDNKVSVEISVADNKTTATGLKSVSYQLDSNDAVSLTQDTWASKKTDSCSKTFDVSDRGVHTLTVTAEDQAGNTATQAITFAVYAAPKVTLTPTASIIYDGEAVAAGTDFTLNAGGSAGTVTYSYKKTGEADSAYVQGLPTDAGTYVIKADVARDTAHQYQAASVTSEITIAQKTAALTWTDMKFTYDGTEHAPSASVTNLVTGDAGRVSVTVVGGQTHANAHEGNTSYTATAEALTGERAANYKLPESGLTQVFTIDQKTAQLAWTNTEFTYDGAGHLPQATVMNLVGTDTAKDICTVTVNSGTGVINAGTYTLAATVLSNKDYKLPDAAADKQTTVTVNSKQLTAAMISLDSTDNIYAVTHAAITPAVTVKDSAIDTAQGGRTLVICTSETKNAGDYTLSKDTQATACGAYKMTVTGCNNYTGEVDITWYITDPNAPEGTIEISENKWTAFWNHVTFGKFFNKTQTVTITGSEDASESGVSEICYYLSDAELTQEELNALSDEDWKKLDTGDDTTGAAKKSGSFTMDPDSRQIVYARIADASGNITYLNSEGVTLDATKPVITGVTEGVTYCAAQTVTVTDAYLKSVTIRTYGKDADGTTGDTALTTTVYSADAEDAAHMLAADGTYTLPAVNGRVTVTAEDMAGNITEIAVTINDGHTFTDYVRSDNASTQQNATETAKCDFCDATDTREVEGTKLPVPVETVTIAEETEADGKIITAVNVDKELPKTEISNMTAALAKSLLTNTELALVQAGATVKVYLDVTDIDETVSSTDKALTEAAITTLGSNSHVGMYLDLSLFKQINNNPATRLTSSGAAMIRVAVTVPERLRNTDSAYTRTYNVVRIHDGKAELLNPTCEDYVLTFETDKFSTYAIVYTDTAVPVEPGTDTTTETPAVTTTTITQNPTETVQTANPTSAQTGDSVNLVLWISMLLLAATGIVIMTEVRRKRR